MVGTYYLTKMCHKMTSSYVGTSELMEVCICYLYPHLRDICDFKIAVKILMIFPVYLQMTNYSRSSMPNITSITSINRLYSW